VSLILVGERLPSQRWQLALIMAELARSASGQGPKVSPGANLVCTTQIADAGSSREVFSVGPDADVTVLGVEPSQKGWRAKPPQTGDG
jgi:hypothetical protein